MRASKLLVRARPGRVPSGLDQVVSKLPNRAAASKSSNKRVLIDGKRWEPFSPPTPSFPAGEVRPVGVVWGRGLVQTDACTANETNLEGTPQTFRLSLDASFEKSHTGHEIVKDEGGGVIIKSTSQLSANQALDDAIRNAQIPPEYEDIVKQLFSRGTVQ